MKVVLLALSFFAIGILNAQETRPVTRPGRAEASWKLVWGKKTLLAASTEDEAANVVTIKRSDLKKKNTATLTYSGTQSGWNRSITVYGANDAELKVFRGSTASITGAALAKLAKGQTELKVYTMAVPSDPKIAATVRVRRMHLVTIRIKG